MKRTNMLLASGLAAVVVGLASANSAATTPIRAVASSDATVRSITVSFGELDLTKPAGAEALLSPHQEGGPVRSVTRYDSPTPWNLKAQKQCSKTAIDDAVAQVNAPLLSACHRDREHVSRASDPGDSPQRAGIPGSGMEWMQSTHSSVIHRSPLFRAAIGAPLATDIR